MKYFECFKKNGEVNQNKFINTILFNLFENSKTYEDKIKKRFNRDVYPLKLTDKEKESITSSFFQYLDSHYSDNMISPSKNYYYMIYPSQEYEGFYKKIEIYSKATNIPLTKILRQLLEHYQFYYSYSRERIYRKREMDIIVDVIKKDNLVLIIDDEGEKKIRLWGVQETSDLLYNYLLGIDDDTNKFYIKRLSKIKNIIVLEEKKSITKKEMEEFNRIIKRDVEYYEVPTIRVEVKFNREGKKQLLRLDSFPRVVSERGNTFVFDDKEDTIVDFLKQIGCGFTTNNESIKEKLSFYHCTSYNFLTGKLL